MNLAIRKLALIEKDMNYKEENARVYGYSTCDIDRDLKERITELMDKVRYL